MGDAQSRRLRMRFFPEDDQALHRALKLTTLTSQSNVLRAALTFFEQLWTHECADFTVTYGRDGVPGDERVLDTLSAQPREERAKTSKSIEIRITPTDEDRIHLLLEHEAADTASEVVRRALRLYASAVVRMRDGFEVLARSRTGEVVPVGVQGLGVAASPRVRAGRIARVGKRRGPQIASIDELLPKTLADSVKALAAREACDFDTLVVDLIRTEALARLYHLSLHPETPTDPGIQAEPAPVAVESPVVQETPAPMSAPMPEPTPVAAAEDPLLVASIAGTLEHMRASMVAILNPPAPPRPKQAQGDFTDLLFGAQPESEPEPEPVANESVSTLAQLAVLAENVREQLEAVLAVEQRERKPRRNAAKNAKANALPAPGDAHPEQWALVLTTDESGAPQQRVVESQTIIPMPSEDLAGYE